ncbi:serine--tRNA ligase [Candidatus Micrarchaeota archaeon]|nr:serine--tRNA ligase [Candidatus Micrarchaeota archaeon]
MLDIRLVRKSPGAVKADLKRRGFAERAKDVDKLLALDKKIIVQSYRAEQLKKKRNALTVQMARAGKKPDQNKISEAKNLSAKIAALDASLSKPRADARAILMSLPNLLDNAVPKGNDDTGNKIIRRWGKPTKPPFDMPPHGDFLQQAGLADFERAAKISGRGFYFLLGDFALLEQALIQYSLAFLMKKGYSPISTPAIMNRAPYEGVTALSDFEDVMYKIEGEDSYLIATSEHAIAAMHSNEIFHAGELPLKYAGLSPCFRREIGAHGVDTRGLFRVHQFNKVEQFIFCRPEDSKKLLEELVTNAEELLQQLRLPYRVVNVCTGDIGTVAARKYDIDAWFPREQEYKELVSASNCASYQAVRSNIKFRSEGGKEYVHTLNSTAIATSRTLRAIVENFATEKGTIKIPKPLLPYMYGIEEIAPKRGKK